MNDGGVLNIYKLFICVSWSEGRKEKNEKYLLKQRIKHCNIKSVYNWKKNKDKSQGCN